MAGSGRFRVAQTCPNCKEPIIHECGFAPTPAEPLDGDLLHRACANLNIVMRLPPEWGGGLYPWPDIAAEYNRLAAARPDTPASVAAHGSLDDEGLTAIFTAADRLRAYFIERGWSIHMENNGKAVVDPFAAIAEAMRYAS